MLGVAVADDEAAGGANGDLVAYCVRIRYLSYRDEDIMRQFKLTMTWKYELTITPADVDLPSVSTVLLFCSVACTYSFGLDIQVIAFDMLEIRSRSILLQE